MLKALGSSYYIDIDEIIEKCRPVYSPPKKKTKTANNPEDKENGLELNIFKFEVFKACVERILSEYEEIDDKLEAFSDPSSPSFRIAFNTLLKYEILKENYE